MQICVWSTGNAARPIVQAISAQIPEQRATMEGRSPATTKLAVDPFLRIDGAMDAIALGDCSRMTGGPLPATAQVRSACSASPTSAPGRQGVNPQVRTSTSRWSADAGGRAAGRICGTHDQQRLHSRPWRPHSPLPLPQSGCHLCILPGVSGLSITGHCPVVELSVELLRNLQVGEGSGAAAGRSYCR